MNKIFSYYGKIVLALLILVAGYFYKGLPMLASLLVGYFFIWKAMKKYKQTLNENIDEDIEG